MLLAATVAAAALSSGAYAEIGSVSAVNRNMDGTPPQGQRRALSLGNGVVQEERIETSDIGSGQLLFQDQTALTVAPNSDLVLDKYVYDPAHAKGDISLSLTRGTLRFIGGRITKERTATVRTPSATIGIRGGMVLIEVDDQGRTKVIQIAGEFTTVEGKSKGKVTLSRPNASAETDPNGVAEFTGLAEQEVLGAIFKSLEGGGDGGASPATAQASPSTEQVAAVNSDVKGGETRQPVSTSGEQPQQEAEEEETSPTITRVQEPEPPLVVAPPPPPDIPLPAAGNLISTTVTTDPLSGFLDAADTTFDPVGNFASGSIIANSVGGTSVRLPIPSDPSGLTETTALVFDAPDLLAPANENAGYWEAVDEGEVTPAGATASVPLSLAAGYSDLGAFQFHIGFFTNFSEPGIAGTFLFGDATPGGGATHLADDGSFAANAQTVDVYLGDRIAYGGGSVVFDDIALPELLLVGNAGDSRTDGSARWLAGSVRFAAGGFANLTVLDGEVLSDGGGPILSDTAETVTQFSSGGGFQTSSNPRGTLEDSEGNTLWGETGEYLVLGPAERPEVPGGLGPLQHANGDIQFHSTAGIALTGLSDASTKRYQRAPGRSEVITDPYPLASDAEVADGLLTRSANFSGFARCDTGNCGGSLIDGDATGIYHAGGFGDIVFNTGFLGNDENQLGIPSWRINTDEANIGSGSSPTFSIEFVDGPALPDHPGTHVTDNVFGLAASDEGFLRFTPAGTQAITESSFLVASHGLVGDGGLDFGAPVNLDPTFSRWGWWAASYDVEDGTTGAERRDVVIPSPFVLGGEFPTLLPTTGAAEYKGFAVGQQANLNNGVIQTVGGTYSLLWDFGSREGEFSLSLPGVNVNIESLAVFEPSDEGGPDVGFFEGSVTEKFGEETVAQFTVDGRFVGDEDNPDGGAVGTFDLRAFLNNTHTTGIFAGDKNADIPGLLPLPASGAMGLLQLANGSLGSGLARSELIGADFLFDPFVTIERGNTFDTVNVVTASGSVLPLNIPQGPNDPRFNGGGTTFGSWGQFLAPADLSNGARNVTVNGISDLDPNHQFHALLIAGLVDSTVQPGVSFNIFDFAVLADPAPGGGFLHPLDTGTLPVEANTVEVLDHFANLVISQQVGTAGGNFFNGCCTLFDSITIFGPDILLIGNAGENRIPETATAAPDGARWLAADVQLSEVVTISLAGDQSFQTKLGVLAAPVRQDGSGNLALSAEATTLAINGFIPNGGTSNTSTQITKENLGNFPTADGTTVFGPQAQYQVIGTFNRGVDFAVDGVGELNPLGTGDDSAGTTTFITGENGSGAIIETVPNQQIESLYIRDDAKSEIVLNPFPLAPPTEGFGGEQGLNELSTTGFAIGHAFCSDGDCDNNGTGVYEAHSDQVTIEFGNRGGVVGPDVFGNPDSNTASAEFIVNFPNGDVFGQVPDGSANNADGVKFGSVARALSDDFGAAASDSVFGINMTDAPITYLTTGGANEEDGGVGTFLVASSELAGVPPDFFPSGVDETPEFLRWGYWAADYEVDGDDDGQRRHDTIPVGFWVAGPDIDVASLPATGTAEYSGLVAASLRNTQTNAISHHGGSFGLNYDFGTREGSFDYSLRGAPIAVSGAQITGNELDATYTGGIAGLDSGGNVTLHDIRGTFYGNGFPTATGGTIDIRDDFRQIEGQAVFGGDVLTE